MGLNTLNEIVDASAARFGKKPALITAGPNVRFTMENRSRTDATPRSASGSKTLHELSPKTRTDSPMSIVAYLAGVIEASQGMLRFLDRLPAGALHGPGPFRGGVTARSVGVEITWALRAKAPPKRRRRQ